MESYIFGLIYILIGFLGGGLHYIKKRYVDETTRVDFLEYLSGNKKETLRALYAIIGAEISLSLLHSGDIITLSELVGAITVGYTADSGLNKAPDQGN